MLAQTSKEFSFAALYRPCTWFPMAAVWQSPQPLHWRCRGPSAPLTSARSRAIDTKTPRADPGFTSANCSWVGSASPTTQADTPHGWLNAADLQELMGDTKKISFNIAHIYTNMSLRAGVLGRGWQHMIYVLSGFTGREKCINLQLRRGQKRIGSELLFAVFQSSSNFRQKIVWLPIAKLTSVDTWRRSREHHRWRF